MGDDLKPFNFTPDLSNSKSARRALYSASLITFIVANLTFTSTKFGLFGLEVVFEQERLVAVGQISVFILLVVFFLRASPGFSDLLAERRSDKINRKHNHESLNLEQLWNAPDQYQDGPDGDRNRMSVEQTHEMNSYTSKRISRFRFLTFSAEIVVSYLLPAGLGLWAISQPNGLRLLTDIILQ